MMARVDAIDGHQLNGGDVDRSKAARHPRWTRQETFILIQAKKVVENGVQRSRRSAHGGSDQMEPKWDTISSFCNQHGVNRSAVQCRKRWGNLVGDFNKIRVWESRAMLEGKESFWSTRSELRRERKLPGFFDREVYDALDGRAFDAAAIPLALFPTAAEAKAGSSGGDEGLVDEEDEEEEEEAEEVEGERVATVDAVFDGQGEAEDGLFSDFEQSGQEENGVVRESPSKTDSPPRPTPTPTPEVTTKDKRQSSNGWRGSTPREREKRRRLPSDGSDSDYVEEKLIKILERNSEMLHTQLETQNINSELEREQHRNQANSLIAAINKLTDVLVKIADKL